MPKKQAAPIEAANSVKDPEKLYDQDGPMTKPTVEATPNMVPTSLLGRLREHSVGVWAEINRQAEQAVQAAEAATAASAG